MNKTLIWTSVAVLAALIVYDKFVKKAIGSSFEEDFDEDDEY